MALKNAESEGNFVPSKKAGPQFACANEEQPQAVLCFLVVALKKCREQDECKEYKKTPSAVYQRK